MAESALQVTLEEEIAVLRLDDGKANGLSPALVAALREALASAQKEAKAVVLVGREGRFSGGFDLKVMGSGDPDAVRGLVGAGAELLLDLYSLPLPVVAACTGHAVAAGALLLLASDLRIGTEGEYKVGLTEVAIGMTLPVFAVELARDRLSKRHFDRATSQAELYAPDAACDAGFLDRLVPAADLVTTARDEAARLGALSRPAFAASKRRAHGATVEKIRAGLEADLRSLTSPAGS
jgi:enoyl-CoA hydratase